MLQHPNLANVLGFFGHERSLQGGDLRREGPPLPDQPAVPDFEFLIITGLGCFLTGFLRHPRRP